MAKRRTLQNVSPERLADGCQKVLENCEEMLDDARLLLENGRVARAYGLAHLANEEMTKIPVLVALRGDLEHGAPVDWEEVNKSFFNHQHKLWVAAIRDYAVVPGTADNLECLEHELETSAATQAIREGSFYVDVAAGHFVSPKDEITREMATTLVEHVDAALGYFVWSLPIILQRKWQPTEEEQRLLDLARAGQLSMEDGLKALADLRNKTVAALEERFGAGSSEGAAEGANRATDTGLSARDAEGPDTA